jgi:hypothetical protein
MRLSINSSFIRLLSAIVIVLVSMVLITCDDNNNKDTIKQSLALFDLSGGLSKCVAMGGYCNSSTTFCSNDYVGAVKYGCPDVGAETRNCCVPTTSCGAIGGVCMNWLDTCPSGSPGGTGPMDCPNGDLDQCCLPPE